MKSNFFMCITILFVFLIITPRIYGASETGSEKHENMFGKGRLLLGSSPPNCVGKCGGCNPCDRLLVDIGDERVWRCKCNGKIYPPNKLN
ncbi:hypothetical protein ACS0TY_032945 [Phlomoides rotata]